MSTICKAQDPRTCRYHGSGSSAYITKIRNKMELARQVHSAASTQSERLDAQYNVAQAELEYYGTEEGRSSLISHINTTENLEYRQYWQKLITEADEKREFWEQTEAWAKPAPRPQHKLTFNDPASSTYITGNSHTMVRLSSGKYKSQEEYSFEWDATNGQVLYEESDNIESFRILGTATDLKQAQSLANRWFHAQWSRHETSINS